MADYQAGMRDVGKTTSIFSGSTRWVIAILVVIGPLLQAIEFLLESGQEETTARVAFWSEFPSRSGPSMASSLLAVPFLLGGVALIMALTRTHSHSSHPTATPAMQARS